MSVGLSTGARATLFSLTSIRSQMGALQARLASGKKVNSALDNPGAFFTASSLSARAGLISNLTSNMVDAKSTIGAANNGIAAIQALLNSAKSVANQALQSTAASLVTVTGTNASALSAGSSIASLTGTSTTFKYGDTVTVSDGTTTATYTAAAGDTVQTFLNAVNNTAGLKVTASLNASGKIELAATTNVGVTVGATLAGVGGATLTSVLGLSAGTTAFSANTTRTNLAAQFDTLVTQINQAALDSGLNGLNLLTGSSLSVVLNESGTSSLTVTGTDLTASGLGVVASTNGFQTDADVNAALTAITNAIATVKTASARFGSMETIMQTRMDFNSAMVNTLTDGAAVLTANDPNEDSAMLLALQTRQQIAATTLSLTQGADSAALMLFGLRR